MPAGGGPHVLTNSGGERTPGSTGRREGGTHRKGGCARAAGTELVQDDVAVAPALRSGRRGAVRVRRPTVGAAVAVGVHPVEIRFDDRRQASGPDRAAPRHLTTPTERRRKAGIVAHIRSLLGRRIELRRHVAHGCKTPVDPLVVDDDEHLLGHGESRQVRLGDVQRSDTFLGPGRIDRSKEVIAAGREIA